MSGNESDRPLIVQSDRSILAEADSPVYPDVRDLLSRFAELEKSPEHIHTYRISPLSLWNAAASGLGADEIVATLRRFSRYDIPQNIERDVHEFIGRYGRIRLVREGEELHLVSTDQALLVELSMHRQIAQCLVRRVSSDRVAVLPHMRGHIKQVLVRIGYPVEDCAGFLEGADLPVALKPSLRVRAYQDEAARVFWAGGTVQGGSGVIVLPCGAGKTIVGLAVMALAGQNSLILTTSITAVRQWRRELLDKTMLDESQVGEYTGEIKDVRPVTIATYNILTYRPDKNAVFPHFELFARGDWGLIVYDEVHLLPAPVFRITADIQARRRLGLTATLVREDGREEDVFSLIGPKRYDVPWKVLEAQGWIAQAECIEVRLPLASEEKMEYAFADQRAKFRQASENPGKVGVIEKLLCRHETDRVLIIGQYLDQLADVARRFGIPIITGKTPNPLREELYADFRTGALTRLIVSKVGNFAIDLPDANVLIQISGTFGSRQEEAQRLGRILRPKQDGSVAQFYSVVTRETREQDFAMNRQLFLTEQGYRYRIVDVDELGDEAG